MQQPKFQIKANYIFANILILSAIFVGILFLLLSMIYSRLFIIGKSFFGKLETLCGCTDHISFVNHPYFFSFLTMLGLVSAILIIKSLFRVLKFKKNTQNFIKINLKESKVRLSSKLKKIVSQLGLKGKVIENNQEAPIIFCYGVLRPKICISQGVVKKLKFSELRAVLLHEKQHLLTYEPAKLFIIKTLERFLFFLPYFKYLANRYVVLSELAADELATNGFLNKNYLAKALTKIITWEGRLIFKKQLAISFFSATIEERINRLTNDNYVPKNKIFNKIFLLNSLAVLIAISVLGLILKFNNTAFAATHGQQCLSTKTKEQMVHSDECVAKSSLLYLSCQSFDTSSNSLVCK